MYSAPEPMMPNNGIMIRKEYMKLNHTIWIRKWFHAEYSPWTIYKELNTSIGTISIIYKEYHEQSRKQPGYDVLVILMIDWFVAMTSIDVISLKDNADPLLSSFFHYRTPQKTNMHGIEDTEGLYRGYCFNRFNPA